MLHRHASRIHTHARQSMTAQVSFSCQPSGSHARSHVNSKLPTGCNDASVCKLLSMGSLANGRKYVTLREAIAAAESILPGHAAPDGVEDARWQAVIEISHFVREEPESVWPFVLRWGSHEDQDLRAAIATCLLEHLLGYHFDLILPRVEAAAKSNACFAKTTAQCWKFGEAKHPEQAKRFDRLCAEIRESRT